MAYGWAPEFNRQSQNKHPIADNFIDNGFCALIVRNEI